MKKLLGSFILSLLFFFANCSKDSNNPTEVLKNKSENFSLSKDSNKNNSLPKDTLKEKDKIKDVKDKDTTNPVIIMV